MPSAPRSHVTERRNPRSERIQTSWDARPGLAGWPRGCPLASRDRAGNPARSQQRRPCWNQRPRHCLSRDSTCWNERSLPAASCRTTERSLPSGLDAGRAPGQERPEVCTRWHHLRPIRHLPPPPPPPLHRHRLSPQRHRGNPSVRQRHSWRRSHCRLQRLRRKSPRRPPRR